MELTCQLCGREVEAPDTLKAGQSVRCPFCNGKFTYGTGAVVEAKPPPAMLTACPQCGNVFEVDAKYEGTRQACPECGRRFTIWQWHGREAESVQAFADFRRSRAQEPQRVELPPTTGKRAEIPGFDGTSDTLPKAIKEQEGEKAAARRREEERKASDTWAVYTPAAIAAAKGAPAPVPAAIPAPAPAPKPRAKAKRGSYRKRWAAKDRRGLLRNLLGLLFTILILCAAFFAVRTNHRYQESAKEEQRLQEEQERREREERNRRIQEENTRIEEASRQRRDARGREREQREAESRERLHQQRTGQGSVGARAFAETFNRAKAKFAARFGFASEAPLNETPQNCRLQKKFWCVFPADLRDGILYELTTQRNGRLSSVRKLTRVAAPEAVDAAAFSRRLQADPSASTAGDGRVWFNGIPGPTGTYPVPKRGRSFRIKDAYLRERGDVAALIREFGMTDPTDHYRIRIKSDSGKTDRVLGTFSYGETMSREFAEEAIAYAIGVRPDDSRVDPLLDRCRLIVEAERTTIPGDEGPAHNPPQDVEKPPSPVIQRPPVRVSSVTLRLAWRKERKDIDKTYWGERQTFVEAYSGNRLSCRVEPSKATVEVTVEAYFLVKEIDRDRPPHILGDPIVQTFTFGGSNPGEQRFDLASDSFTQELRRYTNSCWHNGVYYAGSHTVRTGLKYHGLVVRVLVDGKVRKAVADGLISLNDKRWYNAVYAPDFRIPD